jgi:type II secretory pathway pseudopilin PulG
MQRLRGPRWRLLGHAQRGFTFIGVLILTAVLGIGLAGLGRVWSVQAQRDREQELLFVGDQFRAAILSYSAATPAGKPRYPRDLEDLLDDRRHPVTRRHLRQLYPDPLTGKADWEIVRGADGGIVAVHSRSTALPIKVGNFPRQYTAFDRAVTYRDWVFGAPPPGNSPARR